jgi:hypothetical protein
MANERGPSDFAPAQEHAYLPHLDGRRSNRVLLIDGDRGTGKSTLLVTLLKGYGKQVLGEEPSEKFERMDGRIIPIGIIDLQPLPPQTNLPLHIAAHLKRVVEVVEPLPFVNTENSAPLWEQPPLSQLREKWQRLMRLLATWDESLEGRVGRSDVSAFVVETIEEELERGQLPERFREAVDALVDAYAKKYPWPGRKKPLFLLAIDDADMNPRLSVKLLELLRKLWHPRLAFLVAGDSELFLSRLREALHAQGSKYVPEQGHYDRLAEDIYAKDIPSSARFQLDSLTPSERVKRISEIRKLLKRYMVEVHHPVIPRDYPESPPSLRDYLLVNKQSTEFLPNRLRQIDELTARLRRETVIEEAGNQSSAALRVIKWLWDQTVMEHCDEENQPLFTNMVRSSRLDGRLQLNTQRVRLKGEFEPAAQIHAAGAGRIITLQDLSRFQAFTTENYSDLTGSSGKNLDEALTACWLLATDVATDVIHGSHFGEAAEPFEANSFQFAVASWKDTHSDNILAVPWPLPAWKAPVDYVLFARHWRELLDSGHPKNKGDVGLLARQFLSLAIQIAKDRAVPSKEPAWWDGVADWPSIAEGIAKLAGQADASSPRQQINARWALEGAVLIAAPESCLPVEEARSFLGALKKRLGALWPASGIQAIRLARVVQSNRLNSDRESALQELDASNPTHPFIEALKGRHEQTGRGSDTSNLWGSINRLKVPHLKGANGEKDDISQYGTELRQRALGNLPKSISSAAHLEVERYRRISDSTGTSLALVGLWRLFAERMAHSDIADWFVLQRANILISKEALKFAEKLRHSILSSRNGVAREIVIDRSRSFYVERFAPVGRSPDLPASIDALFRIIFDYVQDQDDASARLTGSPKISLWPVVFTQMRSLPENPLHSWPAVSWLSLKEYENFEADWSDLVNNLEGWLGVDQSEHKPYAVDALALNYLKTCKASRWRDRGGWSIESNANEAQFVGLLKSLLDESREQPGRRSQLFSRWIESLPLMGTPEAALSGNIANVFVEHAFGAGMGQAQLREMRRERARADGVDESRVEALLGQIDRAFPDHPWVKRVEARRSSGTRSAGPRKSRS